jgi:Holliday junction DNA helicase RuvB
MKAQLEVSILAAVRDDRPLDHILLCGHPGAGKSTLAAIVAARWDEPLMEVTCPITPAALTNIVRSFSGVLLLDEIHRFPKREQEALYTLLRDGYLQDHRGKRTEAMWLCVIGATTNPELVNVPLMERFPLRPTFDDYTDEQMTRIVQGMAGRLGIENLDPEIATAFGKACAGTPRRAEGILAAYRDLPAKLGRNPTLEEALHQADTSSDGLTLTHVRYIEALDALGGVKGIKTLARLMRLPAQAVEHLERDLLLKGYLELGDRGRELTPKGMARARGLEDETNGRGGRRGRSMT